MKDKSDWKPDNLKEAIALAERYETITLEEIKACKAPFQSYKGFDSVSARARKLTGFGGPTTCTLCIAVDDNCHRCIYPSSALVMDCLTKHNKTYQAIDNACCSRDLLRAYRKRAVVLRKLIKKYI